MAPTIPLGDLKREYAQIRAEIDGAIERVLRRGWFVLGEEVEAFEIEWAAYCGAAHAVGVGNGTDAIEIVLRAAGIGRGDEVIVPALTAAFTALAVSAAGATPVFADVDPARYTLDPAAFEAAITPRTQAVLPVHLYGCPADMTAIGDIARRYHLLVIEDAAQAHGATYGGRRAGTLGDVAIFSFYPSKNLGAYGDGGAIVSNDASLAAKARLLRHGGQRVTYEHELAGVNSRLDEIQAAILRAKLPHLEAWNARRQALAARYGTALAGSGDLVLPSTPPDTTHVFHLYAVRSKAREALRDYLAGAGVGTGTHYPKAVPLQPAFAGQSPAPGTWPHAEAIAGDILSLPMFPQLEDGEVRQIANLMRIFFAVR